MASDCTENENSLLQLEMKLNKFVLNASFFLAPSVTFSTFSKPLPAVPTNLWLIFLLGAIWRIETLEGDGIGSVQTVKTTSCSCYLLLQDVFQDFWPPLLALRDPRVLGMIAEFAICTNYMASLLTSSIHFVQLISLSDLVLLALGFLITKWLLFRLPFTVN